MDKNFFEHYQQILSATFNFIRAKYSHNGDKGSCVENILREFIGEYISKDLNVGHGEIVDSFKNKSKQTDVIICNQLQPFIKDFNIPNIFIIETVTCAGEVKTILTTLEDSVRKCNSFKLLQPKPTEGEMLCANPYDKKRFYDRRPFFLFAFDSNLTIEAIVKKLQNSYTDKDITEQIDAVFILNKGCIINYGDGSGALQYIDREKRTPFPGFVHISNSDKVIENFLIWLIAVMPRMVYHTSPLIHYLLEQR